MLSLLSYCGRYFFLFEQLDSFRVQWLSGCAVVGVLAIIAKERVAGSVVLLIALLHGCQLYHLYVQVKTISTEHPLRVFSSNLLDSNRQADALLIQIETINPDVIVFQEYTSRWHQVLTLTAALKNYPHKLVEVIDSPFGIALYSKHPFTDASIKQFASKPAIDVTILVKNKRLRILGVHPNPPMSPNTFASRNRYFQSIVTEARSHGGPLIVAGDFNAVPWSAHFKQLLNNGKLKSSRTGFGLKPTWPGSFAPLWIPIDHILYNRFLSVVDFNTGDSFGSDHKPIWAEFSLL